MEYTKFDIKVLKLSEIPDPLRDEALLCLTSDCKGSMHQVHYDDSDEFEDDELDNWIIENHPDLKDEDFFFFHVDI